MSKLSVRGERSPASPIRRLTPFADDARSRGVTVLQLNIGQPDIETPQGMLDAYRKLDDSVIAYAPSDGFRDYREKLAAYYGPVVGDTRAITADDIVVTVGGSEALCFAIAATCDPGDEIIVCEPFYTNYAGFAHMLSVTVRPVTTYANEEFKIHVDRIAAAVTDKTRAICLPTPGNPTGVVLSEQDLEGIAELCRKHDLFFISDEVYREFVYEGPEGSLAPSALAIAGFDEHAVVIDSVSKRYSACGARVGALVTRNAELRAAALRFAQARLSPATIDQYAAMAALDTPRSYFRQVVNEYRARRDALVAGLKDIGVECSTPQGAFYLVATLPVQDADDFCEFLLREFQLDGQTVMLAPASGFYATPGLGKNEVRIAYVLDRERLDCAVRILGAGLEAYRAK